MKLNDLLCQDHEAHAFFSGLSHRVQEDLRSCGGDIGSLAALREYANNLGANQLRADGIPMDPEQRAQWTMEHQT